MEPKGIQYWKVLNGHKCHHGGAAIWRTGRWKAVKGKLIPCENGLHLCRSEHLVWWLGPTIWEAEADETELIDHGDKVIVRKARIVRRLDTWNDQTALLFAADCAEHVLHLFEAAYPEDGRPRDAIAAARAYANGEIDASVVAAARAARNARAAADAAWNPSNAVAWNPSDAAWNAWAAADAARAAAWGPSNAVAWNPSDAASKAAADAARAAAWDTAATARAAARAARDAGWAAECAWQTKTLMGYLYP